MDPVFQNEHSLGPEGIEKVVIIMIKQLTKGSMKQHIMIRNYGT